MTKPTAPKGLTRRSAALWRAIVGGYVLSAGELEVLRQACASLDRADEAAVVLADQGLLTVDRYGATRAHPAVDVELRHRMLFARLIAQLGVHEPELTSRGHRRTPGPRRRVAPRRKDA